VLPETARAIFIFQIREITGFEKSALRALSPPLQVRVLRDLAVMEVQLLLPSYIILQELPLMVRVIFTSPINQISVLER
jgi:hypothetical protein